jgi:KDO2-lipid IV(A) lauroyltransferase
MRGSGARVSFPAPSYSFPAVLRFLALLPLPLLYLLTGLVARTLRLLGVQKKLVARNLERCFPGLDQTRRDAILKGFYAYLGELAAEVPHGSRMDTAELDSRVRFENPELVTGALADGKRVMLVAAHHCNWEWLLLACSRAFGAELTAAYKPPSRAWAAAEITTIRERFGATMVDGKQLVQHLIERRGGVRLLALLADQSPAASSLQQQTAWLDFFGQSTAFLTGPGWITARMGYVPYFTAMRRESKGRYTVRFVPLVPPGERADSDAVLRAYVRELESQIRAHPEQYFWAYNRWKRERPLYG